MARREYVDNNKNKKLFYIFLFTLSITIGICLIAFGIYSRRLRKESQDNLTKTLGMTNSAIVDNNGIAPTSFSEDLSVASGKNTINNAVNNQSVDKNVVNKNVVNKNVVDSKINKNKTVNSTTSNSTTKSNEIKNSNTTSENNTNNVKNNDKELKFIVPVEGEIIKDYAKDTLIFSNTLEEWTTHPGIDIKAPKTTIVKSSEAGVIESIKNDPRYGLTVIIKHSNNFKTVYSNLLTTEFVSENESVEKGQTIGTVGNTASFEVSDEDHLHFEMYKDGNLVNPTIYLK